MAKINSFQSCYKCSKRTVNCHSSCEDYKREKQQHDEGMQAYKDSRRPIIREGDFLGDSGLARRYYKR